MLPYELDLDIQLLSNLAESPENSPAFVLQEVIFVKKLEGNWMLTKIKNIKLEFRPLCSADSSENMKRKKKQLFAVVLEKVQQLEIRSEQTIHSESSQLHWSFQGPHSILP